MSSASQLLGRKFGDETVDPSNPTSTGRHRRRAVVLVVVAAVLLLCVAGSWLAGVRPIPGGWCGLDGSCQAKLVVSPGWSVPLHSTSPVVDSVDARDTEAIVVVQGFNRHADDELAAIQKAAVTAGADGHTLVISPWFQAPEDNPGEGDTRWARQDWSDGEGALAPAGLSSFTVMDQMLTMLADRNRFPNLTRVTLVGHSAGGQFVQRYAALGQAPAAVSGLDVRYVVANPSSYLVLEPARPDLTDPSGQRWAIPGPGCPGYNDYKYGLGHLIPYSGQQAPAGIVTQYLSRRVTYLAGEGDRKHDRLMDDVCAAQLQGSDRWDRGLRFFQHLHQLHPTAPHDRVVVTGVGHGAKKMFNSTEARGVLFTEPKG